MTKQRTTVVVSARIPIPQRAVLLKITGTDNPSVAIKKLLDQATNSEKQEPVVETINPELMVYSEALENTLLKVAKMNWWQFRKWRRSMSDFKASF